jgi:acetyl-CoA carboxylase carboxyltransferase component/biotin carboxyl carrier protein
MLAKIIAVGDTRDEALARLEDALGRTVVAIEGGPSNRCLLGALCAHDAFRAGPVTTRWLDRVLAPDSPTPLPCPHRDIALAAGAIGTLRRARAEEVASLLSLAQRGLPPAVPPAEPRTVRFVTDAGPVSLEVLATGPGLYRVLRDGHRMRLRYRATGAHTATLTRGDARWEVVEIATPTAISVEVDGVAHRIERASEGRVVAPVPAAVTALCVHEGDRVREGDRVVLLEVMKMELAVTAPAAGRVARVLVSPASRVVAGQPLVLLDTAEHTDDTPAPAPAPVVHSETTGDVPPVADVLRGAMLGYDLSPAEIDRCLAEVRAGDAPISRETLHTLLAAFVDGERLFDARPAADGVAPADHLARYLRWRTTEGLPADFLRDLRAALAWHRLDDLGATPAHDDALARVLQAHGARSLREDIARQCIAAALRDARTDDDTDTDREALRAVLEAFAAVVVSRARALAESAYTALYRLCERPRQRAEIDALRKAAARAFVALADPSLDPVQHTRLRAELEHFSHGALLSLLGRIVGPHEESTLLELLVRRLYPEATLSGVSLGPTRLRCTAAHTTADSTASTVLAVLTTADRVAASLLRCGPELDAVTVCEVFVPEPDADTLGAMESAVAAALDALPPSVTRVSINWGSVAEGRLSRTYRRAAEGFREAVFFRDLHPTRVEVTELARFDAFELERLEAPGELLLVRAQARSDPSDRRLVCIIEVERVDPVRDPVTGALLGVPSFERAFLMAMYALRAALERPQTPPRPYWNRVVAFVRPLLTIRAEEMDVVTRRLATATAGLGLEKMVLRCRVPSRTLPEGRPMQLVWTNPTGHGATLTPARPNLAPVAVLTAAERRVMEARRRGLLDPYELVRSLTHDRDHGPLPPGEFTELDLDDTGTALVPVQRPFGQHRANLVVGKITNRFGPFPEGLPRVLLVGDPTRAMGALAEAECRRVIAALDYAEREGLTVEWVAVSSGARIAMDSGTENLDWTARALARIVAFTQSGGTLNVLVDNVNVGAQSYWNAEATMLPHTRGTLVMTPAGSMLLTGKRALEYAGSVAAEDNAGIGGYARVMGPNGQAQYFAPDLQRAYALLLQHLTFTVIPPGERRPRRLATRDPDDRDITRAPYHPEDGAEGFRTVGEIFDEATNPGRKRPFAIRAVMRAVLDADIRPLERWTDWQGAESAVVWEASLGGDPVCCIGIESHPLPRRGETPADGPAQWTSGTLFPQSSKKVARALNAASGVRPVVVLANLSGFDGSPDSLRHLQLEYGAEIGRAVVNFRGPLVFCVVGRYHGGAYVVFSRALNPGVRAVALEGAFASVIGGGPAAAVVFPAVVRKRAENDPAVLAARAALESSPRAQREAAAAEYTRALREAEARVQAALAREFDAIHSVERALAVGSLEAVLPPQRLRPALIDRIRTPSPPHGAFGYTPTA